MPRFKKINKQEVTTIIEDIVTWGAGIWNDALSFAGAAASMSPIIVGGLRAYGL